jgi:hypothetical protein
VGAALRVLWAQAPVELLRRVQVGQSQVLGRSVRAPEGRRKRTADGHRVQSGRAVAEVAGSSALDRGFTAGLDDENAPGRGRFEWSVDGECGTRAKKVIPLQATNLSGTAVTFTRPLRLAILLRLATTQKGRYD